MGEEGARSGADAGRRMDCGGSRRRRVVRKGKVLWFCS